MASPNAAHLRLMFLSDALVGRVPYGQEANVAYDLLHCVQGATLQLNRLETAWIGCAYSLGEGVWTMLDRLTPGGIHTVEMPPAASCGDLPALALALSGLKDLRRLDLPVPRAGELLDLSALRLGYPGSFHLHLDIHRCSDWMIKVPEHTRVHAGGAEREGFHPYGSLVVYTDTCGQPTGEHHALEGVTHWKAPPGFDSKLASATTRLGVVQQGMLTNNNCEAHFPTESRHLVPGDDKRIVCRHIATWVLDQWRRREAGQLEGPQDAQVYGELTTPERVRENVEPWTDRAWARAWERPAAAVFTDAGFGAALRRQFEQVAPGRAGLFMINTFSHALALALRVVPLAGPDRPPRHSYEVEFFDPNFTVTGRMLTVRTLDELEKIRLSQWAGCHWEVWTRPNEPGGEPCVMLTDYVGPDGPQPPRSPQDVALHGITDRELGAPSMLAVLMRAGAAEHIPRCVDAIVANWDAASPALAGLLAGYLHGRSALLWTVSDGCREGVEEGVEVLFNALLRLPPTRLDPQDLPAALNPVGVLGQPRKVLEVGLHHDPHLLASYARAVLAPEHQGLGPATRMALMNQVGSPPGPLLAQLVRTFGWQESSDRRSERVVALQQMLQAILGARHLPEKERIELLNGPGRSGEVWLEDFGRALRGASGLPAAVLLCHLHEHGGPIRGELGHLPMIPLEDVLAALYRDGSELSLQWASALSGHRNAQVARELASDSINDSGASYRPLEMAHVLREPLQAAAMVRKFGSYGTSRTRAFLDPRPRNGGRSLLHALVDAATPPSPTWLAGQDALYHVVHEWSYPWSDETGRRAFIGARERFAGGFGTAAQAALRVDPDTGQPVSRDAAAAMVCAVLEAVAGSSSGHLPELMIDRVIAALGLTERMVDVLGPRPAGWPAHRLHWSERILLALSRLNPSREPVSGLVRRAAQMEFGLKVPKPDTAALDRFRAALRDPGKRQWQGKPIPRDMAARMRGLVVVRQDGNPALVVCRGSSAFTFGDDPLAMWRTLSSSRAQVDLRANTPPIYLLPLDGFESTTLRVEDAPRFETPVRAPTLRREDGPVTFHGRAVPLHAVLQAALLAAPGVTLAGSGDSLRQACRRAHLHALGPDPARPGHLLCLADGAVDALAKFAVPTPADAKSSQARGVFYSIAATQLEALPAVR